MRYSIFSLLRQARAGNTGWPPAWRKAQPKPAYDVVIVGGGAHGLATAWALARTHGITNVAVVEKGWIGSGNSARTTTILRSSYLQPALLTLHDRALTLWEGLTAELNFNLMLNQQGALQLFHSARQRDLYARRGNAMRLAGIEAELLDRDELRPVAPMLDFDNARFPVLGGLLQRRGATLRHDAVVWGYARAADSRGVDIIESCEVAGFRIRNGRVDGVETSRGVIGAKTVALAVSGNSGRVAAMAGLRLPLETLSLQAFVTESVAPLLPGVLTFGAGHFYVSQSERGGLVFGGDIDGYNSYAQRGNLPIVEGVAEGGMALMPMLGRLRMLRSWGGLCDMSMDGAPIIDSTPVEGLLLSAGWGQDAFKATPAAGDCLAHLIATGAPHPDATAFRLDRFATGHMIDEKGRGPAPYLH